MILNMNIIVTSVNPMFIKLVNTVNNAICIIN